MKNLTGRLVKVAGKVGAPIVKGVLEKHLGHGLAGSLAGSLVDQIAAKAGVEVERLPDLEEKSLVAAIKETEREAPELITLWSQGLEMQQALLDGEEERGFWHGFWRVGWMYLLAGFWVWRILIVSVLAGFGVEVEAVDFGVLLTLTSWFMALYMGGHTVKELGKNVAQTLIHKRTSL